MMKIFGFKLGVVILVAMSLSTGVVLAQKSQRKAKSTASKTRPAKKAPVSSSFKSSVPARPGYSSSTSMSDQAENELRAALALTKLDPPDYAGASARLFRMTRDPRFMASRNRIKYVLGLMLFEMKLFQVAAFQFVDVVRQGDPRYVKQALQKLSVAADISDDDTLLNYAIGRISIEDFPAENRDMLRYRFGEFFHRKGQWEKATQMLAQVPQSSIYFSRAKYLEALSYVKLNELNNAIRSFNILANARAPRGVTDTNRVAAVAGLARVYYQAKKWDLAADFYRQVPRDTELWHDVLFEQSWAHLRSAEFRSVLSNLHSLHSPYYEDFWIPESILLRGIVYLYICQYDEMEKTLALFERLYQPVQNSLESFTRGNSDSQSYFNEVEKVARNYEKLKADPSLRKTLRVPFMVSRSIFREGDFKNIYGYITQLRQEESVIHNQPVTWKRAAIGQYASQLIKGRLNSSMRLAGEISKNHMLTMKQELEDLFEQYNFARYEMINGRKETLKKKIQGKGLLAKQVDESQNRDFYIQNGFEYWPFRGEYWLDEIGDYHYLGTQGCE
ncbi:MAG: hypothetical protein IT289_00435 [Oligoflexia bacterium]|nr:hypothetical protein [Oligoflexia bacterium]